MYVIIVFEVDEADLLQFSNLAMFAADVDSTFTHVIVTAPSQDIANVYRFQLDILKQTVPFLSTAVVMCVSDPNGNRVGSGGGTLNALAYLKAVQFTQSFDQYRVLVVHSGGESRRAPLNSLCGKAWTTLNSVVEGNEIASPIVLLISELSKFSKNLQLGSVVVASSDVMLDIATEGCNRMKFPDDCVTVVAVPVNPKVAKNHGVIVAFDNKNESVTDHITSHDGTGVYSGAAVQYMQKPSLQKMKEQNALYTPLTFPSLLQRNDAMQQHQEPFALVDSGVVVFTGAALSNLLSLLDNTTTAACTDPKYAQSADLSNSSDADSTTSARAAGYLRLELYTDLLCALAVRDQSDFSLSVYLSRLGVDLSAAESSSTSPTTTTTASLYHQALPVVWNALSRTPLHFMLVCDGQFEHLGTTAEVLLLLTLPTAPAGNSNNAVGNATVSSVSLKLRRFAEKYSLAPQVKSRAAAGLAQGSVLINSLCSGGGGGGGGAEGGAQSDNVHSSHAERLVEHCVLNSDDANTPGATLPTRGILSHISGELGKNLKLNEGIMMQQVYLKPSCCNANHGASMSCCSDTPLVPVALIVLSLFDDMKVPFAHNSCNSNGSSSSSSTVCGSAWESLFKVGTAPHRR